MALWFDVDDLVRYFCVSGRPTGIQRLSLVMFRELQQRAGGGRIYFCRRLPGPPFFRRVAFLELDKRLRVLIDTPPPAAPSQPTRRQRAWVQGLSPRRRQSLGRIVKALRDIFAAMAELARAGPERLLSSASQFDAHDPRVSFRPGDWLINVGSSWN